ncbi:MAG: hypothetical protein JWQ43_3553 [Glaciihabitans sp.]|nr:hypothetical protein [Glaciihabitans sp.]
MSDVEAVFASAYRRFFGAILVVLCAAVVLGIVALDYAAFSRNRPTEECFFSGPTPADTSLIVPRYETVEGVTGRFSLWPLGLECEWDRVDGSGTIVATSENWGITYVAAGGVLGVFVGLVITFAPGWGNVRRRPGGV